MKYKPYPAYKDSGVEWLGKIPEGWEVKRLKWLLSDRLSYGAIESGEIDDGISPRYIRITDIEGNNSLRSEEVKVLPIDIAKPYLLREGDILLSRSGATVGKAFVYKESWGQCCYAGYLIRARFDNEKLFPNFFSYFTQSHLYWAFISSSQIQATIQNVSAEKYDSCEIPAPDINTQRRIISFLDRETSRIDTLIREYEDLIRLLAEKRKALISHAVTKGLDPEAPMKDSGVEWLGMVPEGWEVTKLGHKYEVALGKMLDEKMISGTCLYPYLRNVDVQWGDINVTDLPEMDFDENDRDRFSLKKGDLLVCEGGEVGRSAIWNEALSPCYYQKALHRIRPQNDQCGSPRFLFYQLYFMSTSGIFTQNKDKATIHHLPAETLRAQRFCFPPLPEQLAIAEYLDRETSKIDTLTREAQEAIGLLKEHRAALITGAVTGKIDVRERVTV